MTGGELDPQHDMTGAPAAGDAAAFSPRTASGDGGGPREPGPSTAELDALHAVADLSGQIVGPYRVAARVGGGATAAVYRALDEMTDQAVALKVLLPGADGVARERFRREAQLVSALQHPNIVPTLDIGQTAPHGAVYIAMELVDGPSLAEVLDQAGRLEPLEACRLLAPIARALDFAHNLGVVHRDVKPSNILLRRAVDGDPAGVRLAALPHPVTPLLTDFGIARALDAPELTSVGRTIGTPAFMAPEQCAGEAEIDGRADVYALGAVLYRCLVGRPPFGGTTTQILHAHVYDPVLIPEEVALRIPPAVLGALGRALMKEPSQRYGTAGLLAQELEAFGRDGEQRASSDVPVGEATMTMASLPVAAPPTQTTRVLVPGPPVTPSRAIPAVTRSAASRLTPRTPLVPRPATRRPHLNQAGVLVVGGALGLLLVLSVVTLVMSMMPDSPAAASRTPAASALVSPTAASAVTPVATPTGGVAIAADVQTPPAATPTPSPNGTAAPTPIPTPAAQLASAWDDAQAFFAEREWRSALDWLTIVRRIDEGYEREQVERMMVIAYVGLATDAVVRQQWETALDLLDEALAIQPQAENIVALRAAVAAMMSATGDERLMARRNLQAALAVQAELLAADDNPCAAADQMNAALLLLASVDLLDRQASLRAACRQTEDAGALAELGGAILYSAQEDGVYRIFRLPVGTNRASTLLVENGAQPRLGPNGGTLAYYSRTPGDVGLTSVSLSPAGVQGLRLTDPSEDAADAPPSWSPQGDRLVFSSNRGNTGYRVYLVWADGSRETTDLGYGKDPEWHPGQDLLVFNGIDDTGNRPGLWLMRTNGEGRGQLTDNGNDQRPVWTPDGNEIVFMSSGRDNNWELYRINVGDGTITRLTNDPAQDGLPAISPDGRYVAFMSDRGGFWRLWYVPIEGGEAKPLGGIAGGLPSWLEHAIQWVN